MKVRLKIKGRTDPTEEDPLGHVDAELPAVELNNRVMGDQEKPEDEEFIYDEDGRWVQWKEVDRVIGENCGKWYCWKEVGLFDKPGDDCYICPACRQLPFSND